MANLKAIRGRIKSVKNTGQITRAMQLVATSKMKRAQDKATAGQPYVVLLGEIFSSLASRITDLKHPLFEEREVKKRGILVVSTDKGLCGALNANLFKEIIKLEGDIGYVTVGRKASQFISRTKRELMADFPVSDKVQYAEVRGIVQYMTEAYLDGKIDTIEVLYSSFVNTLVQEPLHVPLVPIDDFRKRFEELKSTLNISLADTHGDDREMMFEPSVEGIMEKLPELYLKQCIFQSMLGAKASEHSARMVAMKAATDNAKKLVGDLTLEYNKARQAAITQEILEIAAATASNSD
ncbi:ATP synthase F1 subunit gamma [Rubellicoccus peritrichatus]|uniref:ATP synthase gamma chain n=1 Tax=Rubellicoccus peritrichatus TaxID=3080537 RepID=A0AAQ3LBK3_9BACT|nr:ATP synthase F1 subunit gamma [Puniceicoccus sp. CR14]WOO42282.1 ATP synthase F1 subunit gamma [Puniceicoccus sp. CR14]